jgi:hypothetical protein
MITKANPITAHEVTFLMPSPGAPDLFGWIRLANGLNDAGYVYLTSETVAPRLSHTGEYIVTSVPLGHAETLLGQLRASADLQIRFFDPEIADAEASVFIEPIGAKASEVRGLALPIEDAQLLT